MTTPNTAARRSTKASFGSPQLTLIRMEAHASECPKCQGGKPCPKLQGRADQLALEVIQLWRAIRGERS